MATSMARTNLGNLTYQILQKPIQKRDINREARALKLLEDIPKNRVEKGERGIGRYLVVEETHYSRNGTGEIIYKGQLVFDSHKHLSISSVVREIKISGKKQFNLFFGVTT